MSADDDMKARAREYSSELSRRLAALGVIRPTFGDRVRVIQEVMVAFAADEVNRERDACVLIASSTQLKSLVTGSERQHDAVYADGYNEGAADASVHIEDDIRARSTTK